MLILSVVRRDRIRNNDIRNNLGTVSAVDWFETASQVDRSCDKTTYRLPNTNRINIYRPWKESKRQTVTDYIQ